MITAAELDELVGVLFEHTRDHLEKSLSGLVGRLDALEDRVGLLALAPGVPGPPGPPGRDVEASTVSDLKAELALLRTRLEHIPAETTSTVANLAETVAAGIASKALGDLTTFSQSITNGRDGLDGKNGLDGAAGRDGVDGKDGKDGLDGVDGKDGRDGLDGKDGRDGLGLAGAVIDRSGHLILTMTDGRTQDVGAVVGADGKDGKAGRDGTDVDLESVATRVGETVEATLQTWPKPKDGRDGVDGKDGRDGVDGKAGLDGVGFDDLAWRFDDRGRLILKFARGEKTLEVPVPCLTDQTTWKYGVAYKRGDGVTYDRSFWICQVDNPKAGPSKTHQGGTKEWRLAVARGRDSKELIKAEIDARARPRDDDPDEGFA